MNEIPLKHPQEIEVWYILPAVRKELVVVLRERGLKQNEIAGLLNITESAVSQYLTEKRAKIIFDDPVKVFIKKAAAGIKDKETAYHQIQVISQFIRNSKALCQIHRQLEENLCAGCDACFGGC